MTDETAPEPRTELEQACREAQSLFAHVSARITHLANENELSWRRRRLVQIALEQIGKAIGKLGKVSVR